MSESPPPDSDDPEAEEDSAAKQMALRLSRQEQAVRELLDPLVVKKLTGDRVEIREQLRDLGSTDPALFQALVLTTRGVEEFFEDVEAESVPAGTVETLEQLHETYGILSDEFAIAWSEKRLGAKNPNPSVSTTRSYDSDSERPLMECEVESEGVSLGEFRVPPSHALSMAETLLAHAGYVVRDTAQSGESIATGEAEQLLEELERLTETVSETQNHIEAIETEGQSGTDTEGLDAEAGGPTVDDPTDYFY